MPPNEWGWCKDGWDRERCHKYHVWPEIPGTRDGGQNRECPVCGGNLSINPARVPKQHIVATCHGTCQQPQMDPQIRRGLIDKHGIDARCLGNFGRVRRAVASDATVWRTGTDAATRGDAARWQATRALSGWLGGTQLKEMCLQAIAECPLDRITADPALLLPSDKKEFYALAERAGVGRYKYELFKRWALRRDLAA